RPISFVSCAASHPYLPSFPTRRSSDLGHVNHGVESLYLNLGQSLFPGFTGCSLHCGFSVFHKACRQGPVAVSGFDSATAKKNPPVPYRDGAGNNPGVLVMNGVATQANITVSVVTFGNPLFNLLAASAAILHCFPRILSVRW